MKTGQVSAATSDFRTFIVSFSQEVPIKSAILSIYARKIPGNSHRQLAF
jgi:hypothetical protein